MRRSALTKQQEQLAASGRVSKADLVRWLSEASSGGVAVFLDGTCILENPRFATMLATGREPQAQWPRLEKTPPLATREQIVSDVQAWALEPLGARRTRRYQGVGTRGETIAYEARLTVVPLQGRRAVLVVLEDATWQIQLATEAMAIGRFQSVLATLGGLAVSGAPVQDIMNEAVRLTAEALNVELTKILVPRESDDHLYLLAGVGWRDDLLGSLTVEGGTHSQAGYAIRERRAVVVRDLRMETRFTPSKLLSEHGGISGMSVPMMVEDRVYGVMGAHCKTVRDFTEKELEFLCSVANTVATVLERWRREETHLQLYHRLFESVQDGIMLTDTSGRLLDWNRALERMTGWRREEVIGQTPAFLKSGKHSPEFYQRLWASIQNGIPFVDRFINRRKDGSEFLVYESISPVKDPQGKIEYFVAILTDLTEREHMLEALRHAEQVKLVGQLAGGILHEVRNPLIGIGSLALHMADQPGVGEAVREKCRLIASEASRIDEILESHLGQLPPRQFEFRPCDLPALLEDTLALLKQKLRASRVAVQLDLPPGLPDVEVSRGHLQQVWLNVFINAIEAMPQGGTITLGMASCRRGVDGVLITIRDTGLGITSDALARIYEPFFTKGKAKGVGLGLTLSRDIIERHGGQLGISSAKGGGALVEIWLPRRQGTGDGVECPTD